MTGTEALDEFLAGAAVGASVLELRPDYRALLIAVEGLEPGAERRRARRPRADGRGSARRH